MRYNDIGCYFDCCGYCVSLLLENDIGGSLPENFNVGVFLSVQVLLFFPLLYLAEYCYEAATENAIQEDTIAFENSNRVSEQF